MWDRWRKKCIEVVETGIMLQLVWLISIMWAGKQAGISIEESRILKCHINEGAHSLRAGQ